MTPEQLRALQEKRNKVHTEMKAHLDNHPDGFNAEAAEKFAKMEGDYDAITAQINAALSVIEKGKQLDTILDDPMPPQASGATTQSSGTGGDEAQAHKEAFFDMVRNGYAGASASSKKILAKYRAVQEEGTGSKGGFLVPTWLATKIITGLNDANWIRQLANVYGTESTTQLPVDASIPDFGWIAESAAFNEADQVFSQITVGAHKTGAIIRVSDELLQDSAFDLESHLTGKITAGIALTEEKAFLTGDGSGKPKGIVISATNAVTAANANAFTSDEIIDFVYGLGASYRDKAVIVGSESFVRAVRKLKDGNGRYIWEPNYQVGEPERLLGKALKESAHLPEIASGETVAVAADFSFYDVADRGGITLKRLEELYAANGQVGFRVHKRVDGQLTLADAAIKFTMG